MIGRTGSTDRVIYRRNGHSVYLSVRITGRFGFYLAFGPGYSNTIRVRR